MYSTLTVFQTQWDQSLSIIPNIPYMLEAMHSHVVSTHAHDYVKNKLKKIQNSCVWHAARCTFDGILVCIVIAHASHLLTIEARDVCVVV